MNGNHLFEPHTEVVVRTALLNNLWAIIRKESRITVDDHRDLQNIMSLIAQEART